LRLPFRTAAVILVAAARLAMEAATALVSLKLPAAPPALPKLPTLPKLPASPISLPAAKVPSLQSALAQARVHWRWGLGGFVAVTGLVFLMNASLSAALLITIVSLCGSAFLTRNQ